MEAVFFRQLCGADGAHFLEGRVAEKHIRIVAVALAMSVGVNADFHFFESPRISNQT
jgi:hypothetical protein